MNMTYPWRTIGLLVLGSALCVPRVWAVEPSNLRSNTVEIYSAGKRYDSVAAYRQHQVREGAGALGYWGDPVTSSAALEESQQGRNIFIQAQERSGKNGASEDLGQLEQMFRKFKEDYAPEEDLQIDFSKLKTVTVNSDSGRVYIIPRSSAVQKNPARSSKDFTLWDNELSRAMRAERYRKAFEQTAVVSAPVVSGAGAELGMPSAALKSSTIDASRLKTFLKRSLSFPNSQLLPDVITSDRRLPGVIDREAHLKSYFIKDPSRN